MNPKNIARLMGILYLIGTVAGILSRVITASTLSAQDVLLHVSENGSAITWGALMVIVMGSALVLMPVVAYPVLRKYSEILALGYVVFRSALEGMAYMGIVVGWLLLLPLSRAYSPGSEQGVDFQVLGKVLLEGTEMGVVLMIVFGLGGLILYSLFYRVKLVPRWLSAWGLIAILLNFVAGLLAMFGVISVLSEVSTILQLPIFFQEIVLAFWLIFKGFNLTANPAVKKAAITSESGRKK